MTTRMNPRKTEPPWRIVDHTADIRVEVCGTDPPELFLNAARALTELLGSEPAPSAEHELELFLDAAGVDELMVDWLREILFYNQARGWIFARAAIQRLSDTTLTARLFFGNRQEGDEPDFEIKAVTYHGLTVEKTDAGYCAKILFDI